MGENTTNTCRMCLCGIIETEQFYFLNNDNELKLQFKLLNFLPEIDLNMTPNPITCNRYSVGDFDAFEERTNTNADRATELCDKGNASGIEGSKTGNGGLARVLEMMFLDNKRRDDLLERLVNNVTAQKQLTQREMEETQPFHIMSDLSKNIQTYYGESKSTGKEWLINFQKSEDDEDEFTDEEVPENKDGSGHAEPINDDLNQNKKILEKNYKNRKVRETCSQATGLFEGL
ncbi:hypothetical protein RN001_011309 [Aquatica leii]|uniref:Uncharacterized protein n=1 Tax=Aquatica leii TaxID=1421715 RepID=A0AAN7SNP2_9COLE|nr:hypothetical protein RN001_011309 [Aquatica leii]